MGNRIEDIDTYRIKSGDALFFDCNIWMFIFCAIGNYQKDKRQKIYSKFFQYALQSGAVLPINSLMLSEFINASIRLAYNLKRKIDPSLTDFKKHYVGTPDYVTNMTATIHSVNQILKITTPFSDEFQIMIKEPILDHVINIGFNDSYYAFQSAKKKWIMVSDDKDLKNIPDLNLTLLSRF